MVFSSPILFPTLTAALVAVAHVEEDEADPREQDEPARQDRQRRLPVRRVVRKALERRLEAARRDVEIVRSDENVQQAAPGELGHE